MKILIISLSILLSSHCFALTTSKLVVLKRDNYQLMKSNYQLLKSKLEQNKPQEFCLVAEQMIQTLYDINAQDMQLVQSLKTYGIDDFNEYAQHINNNSASDIFMFSYFEDKCTDETVMSVLNSFPNILTNLEYLILTHDFWMDAFCPQLPNKCEL